MMLSRESQEQNPKYVHFTNGFPPKELIPSKGLSSGINMHGGIFVGLHEEASSKLTRSQRTIPPLAKGRANYYPVKHRASSGRYREKPNPFDAHKGTEKTGFTPQVIKRSKPKPEKTNPRIEQPTMHMPSNPANTYNIGLKLPRQTVCPISTLLHGNDVGPRNLNEVNYRVLCDVEKEATQNELQGIDEVYKRVCNGSMESLCSLISPVKGKHKYKQAPSMHYIQTSSPLSLTTKPLKTSQYFSTEGSGPELSSDKEDKELDDYQQGLNNRIRKQSHSILVPLPYFNSPSRPPYTAPARFGRETHNRPRIYTPRTAAKQRAGAFSPLPGWSSPSVINFNATELPRISRPATRACGRPTGSIIGVQNKSQTGKVAIVASVDTLVILPVTPPATAASECYQQQLDIPNKEEATADGGVDVVSPDVVSPDIESISSDEIDNNLEKENNEDKTTNEKDSITEVEDQNTSEWDQRDGNVDGNVDGNGNDEELSKSMSGTNVAVAFNVIDETGSVHDVEIYNPEERDLQKQEQVIQEAQEYYQKRKQEIETLLDEHKRLVHEVNDLSKELQE